MKLMKNVTKSDFTVSPMKNCPTQNFTCVCDSRKMCVTHKNPIYYNRQPSVTEHRWPNFGVFCDLNNLREVKIEGDGYCFPNAVQNASCIYRK